jgi:hypothetical protein
VEEQFTPFNGKQTKERAMPNIDVAKDAKVIIELDQSGAPLKVYIANKADGAPLQDLTGNAKSAPKHPTGPNTLRAQMEFHAGNCLKIGTYWFCS